MNDTELVIVAVVLGLLGGLLLGVVLAGARLRRAVAFLEELLTLLEHERARLGALLSEHEAGEEESGRHPSN